jgi:hypothetical protein
MHSHVLRFDSKFKIRAFSSFFVYSPRPPDQPPLGIYPCVGRVKHELGQKEDTSCAHLY